jgi:hypothetical protein
MFNLYWCHNFTNEVATNNMFASQLTTSNLYNPLNSSLTFLAITFLGSLVVITQQFFEPNTTTHLLFANVPTNNKFFCHFKYKECIVNFLTLPCMHLIKLTCNRTNWWFQLISLNVCYRVSISNHMFWNSII